MLLLLMRMRWLRGCVDLASHGDRVRRVSGHGDVRQVRRDSGVDVGDGRPAAGGRRRQQAFITGSDQRRRPGRPAQRPSHRRDHHQTQTRRTLKTRMDGAGVQWGGDGVPPLFSTGRTRTPLPALVWTEIRAEVSPLLQLVTY